MFAHRDVRMGGLLVGIMLEPCAELISFVSYRNVKNAAILIMESDQLGSPGHLTGAYAAANSSAMLMNSRLVTRS